MYDRLRDLIVEGQFGSRPGGDKTGALKGAESKAAAAERLPNTAQGRATKLGTKSRVATERNRLKGKKDAPVKGRRYRSDGADEGGASSEGATATQMARSERDPKNARR